MVFLVHSVLPSTYTRPSDHTNARSDMHTDATTEPNNNSNNNKIVIFPSFAAYT